MSKNEIGKYMAFAPLAAIFFSVVYISTSFYFLLSLIAVIVWYVVAFRLIDSDE